MVDRQDMRELALSHCATRGPRLHHLSLLPLAMVCLCATQCEGGGVTARGHKGQTQRGNQSSLSLCVIQYHACVPMNGCQDI